MHAMQYRITVVELPPVSLAMELDCVITAVTISGTVIMVSGKALDLFTSCRQNQKRALENMKVITSSEEQVQFSKLVYSFAR